MDFLETIIYIIAVGSIIYGLWWFFREGKSLKGKTVLVTGGGFGIGRLMAIRFAQEGAKVVIWDIRDELQQNVVKEIKAKQGTAFGYTCDVSRPHLVKEAAAKVKAEVGKVDILVNNAGVVSGQLLLELDDAAITRTLEVNTLGLFWVTRAFLEDMCKYNEGHIVTIASTCGIVPSAFLSDYCASKFGAIGFHESLRMELRQMKKTGVTTTLVCPHLINTGMFAGTKTPFEFLLPLLEPEYVARKVVEAVKTEQVLLMMPRSIYPLSAVFKLFPTWFADWFVDIMGGTSSMKSFKGRGSQWSKKAL